MTFSPLSPEDDLYLQTLRETALEAAKIRYGVTAWTGTSFDLDVLQQLVDERVFSADQTFELQSLGAVFGDVLVRQTGMHWAIVEDEYGVEAVVRYRDAHLIVGALTVILKRVEDEEPVEVHFLFEEVKKSVARLVEEAAYKKDANA